MTDNRRSQKQERIPCENGKMIRKCKIRFPMDGSRCEWAMFEECMEDFHVLPEAREKLRKEAMRWL